MNTNSLEQLNLFLSKYNVSKDLNLSKINMFPRTKILSPFGICFKENTLSFSSKTYFGKDKTFFYDTLSPFDFERVEYLEDLDLIVLHSNFGFSFRISNVIYSTITKEFWNSLDNKKVLKRGTKICKSGNIKYCSTFGAEIEFYSEEHSIFSTILKLRYNEAYLEEYDINMLISFFDIFNINHKRGLNEIEEIRETNSISLMNPFLCIKKDKLLNKELIFYSYNALF